MPQETPQHTILWDGDCGLCRRAIAWFLKRDRAQMFCAYPYQHAPSPPMAPALQEACSHAVHIIKPNGEILRAGRAALYLLEKTGWGGWARLASKAPFIWFVEIGYRILANNRPFFARFLFTKEETKP